MSQKTSTIISITAAILFFSHSLQGQIQGRVNPNAVATQAIMNAKQLGLALFEFDNDYGAFPSDKTKQDVEESAEVKLPADDKTSNSLLRQLFAAGIIQNEELFFVPIEGAKKGDKVIDKEKALAKGENVFAYIAGLSSAGNASQPLILFPMIPGTTKFDPKPLGGSAIVLRIDMSAQKFKIEEDGSVLDHGVNLLTKEHPVWKNLEGELDIRYPDLLPKK